MLWYAMLRSSVLHCGVVCYAMLHYAVLFCNLMRCAMPLSRAAS